MSQKRIPLPLFRTIMFATDLSERSRGAFDVACSLAREEATRLIVLHINDPVPTVEQLVGYGEFGVPVFLPREAPSAPGVLKERLAAAFVPPTPIPVEYELAEGIAADTILERAEHTECDLLVLGTHGRTGLDRLLMGSVAEAVTRRAPCPVVTVRSSADQAHKPLRTVVLATDFSRHSEAALRVARALARDHGARLVVVHVIERGLVPASAPLTVAEFATARDALDAVCARTDGKDLKCPVESQLRDGDPAPEILAAAADVQCDLLVLGTHGRTGLDRLLMGSVAEAVMRGAACPALTIRWPAAVTARHEPVAAGAHGEFTTI